MSLNLNNGTLAWLGSFIALLALRTKNRRMKENSLEDHSRHKKLYVILMYFYCYDSNFKETTLLNIRLTSYEK